MGELICLHIGQAGVQIGNSCWELFCIEHGISPSGEILKSSSDIGPSTLFSESISRKYTPRTVFVDLEPTVIDEILRGPYSSLHPPNQLISGKEDTGNLFPCGHYSGQCRILDNCLNTIRKLAENCSNLQGFVIFTSIGGGTGSGFGSLLCESLSDDYARQTNLGLLVYPSPNLSNIIVEPINCVLATDCLMQTLDMVVVLDNEALFDICERRLGIERPGYTNINRLIAQVTSSITASLRFRGDLNANLAELQTNLVPYPKAHFLISSYSPLIGSEKVYQEIHSVQEITNECFEPRSMMVKCNPRQGKYLACCLMYRGDVVPKEIHSAVAEIKSNKTLEFVDWCPTGFKCGVNSEPLAVVPGGDIAKSLRGACMIGNNSEVRGVFETMGKKFDALFEKRAFVHWFVQFGMGGIDFDECRENLERLINDYKEFTLTAPVED